jgi:hypothetical protein
VRVDVLVRLGLVEVALFFEALEDRTRDVGDVLPREPVVALDVDAALVHRRKHRRARMLLGEREVLAATPRRDMHDARAFLGADLIPRDDFVFGARAPPRRQLVEGAAIAPADHHTPWQRPDDLLLAMLPPAQFLQLGDHVIGEVVDRAVLLDPRVGQLRVDRTGDVGGQRPGRCRPDQQILVGTVHQRQAHVDADVLDLPAALVDLHVGDSRPTARTPGHHVVAAIDPAALPAGLEETPDRVVVLVRHRVVRVRPVHPLA